MDIRSLGNFAPSGPAYADKGPVGPAAPTNSVKPAAAPAQPVAAVQQPEPAPSAEQVTQAMQSINKAMRSLSQDLEFSVDPDSNRTIIKVVDQKTQEVIRQMPSKEALEIAKAIDKVQGLLIRHKV